MDLEITREICQNTTKVVVNDNEKNFMYKLNKSIGNNYEILQSKHRYCVVDFIAINKLNLNSFHIEHKKRSGDRCGYDTLLIGFNKLNMVDKFYPNCYYCWEYDNDFYYIKHSKKLLECATSYSFNSKVYLIPLDNIETGYDNFIREIIELSNNRY